MPTEIALLDQVILHINHGLAKVDGRRHDRGLNFLAVLLLERAFGTLWRAREDAVRGYSVQSLMLCRAALEDWATLRYCESHLDQIGLWLGGVIEELPEEGRPPRFKQIWDDLGDMGQRMEEIYGVLSQFAHPRAIGLKWLYHWDAESTYLHAGGYFDKRNLTICLYFLLGTSRMLLERIAQVQFRVLGDADGGWVEKGLEISSEVGTFMDRVHDDVLKDAPVEPDQAE
ncbi:MAG: hypothetical protein WD939_10550 [Dehalococcoidia bacterium]